MSTTSDFAPGVAILRWPADEHERRRLERFARPRLLLIDRGTPVPVIADRLEDWAFATSEPDEVRLRAQALAARASLPIEDRPVFDDSGLLWFDGRWAALPPAEERIARCLLDRFEECVRRDELETCSPTAGATSLNSTIKRLRSRLAGIGLAVNTVHGRGYVLARRGFTVAPTRPGG